jgi:iron complex transport system ATP-binding protein
LVIVQDLAIELESREILQDLSFAIEPGDLIFLKGSSGSGKTTLLRMLSGERPSASVSRSVCAAEVPQSLDLCPGVTVHDTVASGRLGQDETALDLWTQEELVQRLDLGHLVNRDVERLSGGERQRVALARALIGRRRLLFLDEPVAHLDAQRTFAVWGLLEHWIQKSQGAALVAVHQIPTFTFRTARTRILSIGAEHAKGWSWA